jgi:hypothetical protein
MVPDRQAHDVLDPVMIPVLRAKSPRERLAMLDAMWRSARDMISSLLRDQYPSWTSEQVERETARRLSYGSQ